MKPTIKPRKVLKTWSKEELDYILAHPTITPKELARHSGRTYKACTGRLGNMRKDGVIPHLRGEWRAWSAEEDEWLKANVNLTEQEKASHLNRTTCAVYQREIKLELRGWSANRKSNK